MQDTKTAPRTFNWPTWITLTKIKLTADVSKNLSPNYCAICSPSSLGTF